MTSLINNHLTAILKNVVIIDLKFRSKWSIVFSIEFFIFDISTSLGFIISNFTDKFQTVKKLWTEEYINYFSQMRVKNEPENDVNHLANDWSNIFFLFKSRFKSIIKDMEFVKMRFHLIFCGNSVMDGTLLLNRKMKNIRNSSKTISNVVILNKTRDFHSKLYHLVICIQYINLNVKYCNTPINSLRYA